MKLKDFDWRQHQYKMVNCLIDIRQEVGELVIRDEAKALSGKIANFRVMYQMGEEDPYPGEWTLVPENLSVLNGIGWIASGDVQPISTITSH